MTAKRIRTAVEVGQGIPPAVWTVEYLVVAREEAMKVLTETRYHHLADQFRELARLDDPTRSDLSDLDAVEDFYELRDKGGPLGKLNVRVFYAVYTRRRLIAVLGFIKKEADGKTPMVDIVRIRGRKRAFERGDYDDAA